MVVPPAPDPRRRRARAAVLLLATAALAAGLGVDSHADPVASEPFKGSASADGVRVLVAAPGYLVVERFADAGFPTAQATADPLVTVGYAGYPWPGSDTYGLLATGGAPIGQDLTNVPTAVRSSSTTVAHDHKDAGPVALDALSSDNASSSSAKAPLATSPATAGNTSAQASVVHDPSGQVVAKSSTRAEAFEVAGVLRIGGMSSTAEVTAPLGGVRKRVSSFAASDITIAGQTVGLTDKGLVVAGTTTPLPADNPLVKVLADQQIQVTYLAPENSTDGVTSAGVRITAVRPVQGLPQPVQIAYVFGRSHAAATGGNDPSAPSVPGPALGPVGTTLPPPATGATEPPPILTPPQVGGVTTPNPAPAAAPEPTVKAPTGSGAQLRSVAALRVDGAWYLVLVLGGVVMTVSASLFRLFGVRALWT